MAIDSEALADSAFWPDLVAFFAAQTACPATLYFV